jgi:hypothetical protein
MRNPQLGARMHQLPGACSIPMHTCEPLTRAALAFNEWTHLKNVEDPVDPEVHFDPFDSVHGIGYSDFTHCSYAVRH